MRYKLTFGAGAAVGYLLGARAGRDRYESLRRGIQRVADNSAVRQTTAAVSTQASSVTHTLTTRATDKARDTVTEAVRDAGRTLNRRLGGPNHRSRAGHESTAPYPSSAPTVPAMSAASSTDDGASAN